jgi:hypothetical protein
MASATQAPDGKHYVEYEEYVDFQLEKTRSNIKLNDILTTLTALAVAVLGYLLAFVVLDQWVIPGGFGYAARVLLLIVLASGVFGTLGWRVLWPLWRRVHPIYAARVIERSDPNLKSNLVNFVDVRQANAQSAAVVLKAMQKRAAVELSHIDVEQAVDRRPLLKIACALLAVVLVSSAYIIFSPKDPFSSVRRALLPTAPIAVATETTITEVKPGDTTVPARSFLDIEAEVRGKAVDHVQVLYTTADHKYVDAAVEMKRADSGPTFRAVVMGENGRGLLQDLTYRIVAGDARTPDYTVKVIQPPSARVDEVHYVFPSYMQFEEKTTDGGPIDGWEGAEVTLKATANMPVRRAHVVLTDTEESIVGEEIGMHVTDGTKLSANWKLEFRQDGTAARFYHVRVTTEKNATDPDPTRYTYRIRPDQRPEVTLLAPSSSDLTMPANGIISLAIQATDPDFLLRSITLKAERSGDTFPDRRLFEDQVLGQTFRGDYDFRLEPLGVREGDTIQFWIEAKDNKQPTANRANTPRINVHIGKQVTAAEAEQARDAEVKRQKEELGQAENQVNPARPQNPPQDDPATDKQQPPGRPDPPQADEPSRNVEKRRPEEDAQNPEESKAAEPGRGRKDPLGDQQVLEKLLQKQRQEEANGQEEKQQQQQADEEERNKEEQANPNRDKRRGQPDKQQRQQKQQKQQEDRQQERGQENQKEKQQQAGDQSSDQSQQREGDQSKPLKQDKKKGSEQETEGQKSDESSDGDRSEQRRQDENQSSDAGSNSTTRKQDDKPSKSEKRDGQKEGDKQQPEKEGKSGDGDGEGDGSGGRGKPDEQSGKAKSKTGEGDAGADNSDREDQTGGQGDQKSDDEQRPGKGEKQDKKQPGAGKDQTGDGQSQGDEQATKDEKQSGDGEGAAKDKPGAKQKGRSKDSGQQPAGKNSDSKEDADKGDGGSRKGEENKDDADERSATGNEGKKEGSSGKQDGDKSDAAPDSKDDSATEGGSDSAGKPNTDKPAGTGANEKSKKEGDGKNKTGDKADIDGPREAADDSPDAKEKQATGKETGEATGAEEADPHAPKAENDLPRKDGSRPGAKKRSESNEPPPKDLEKRPGEEGTKDGSPDAEDARRAPEGKKPKEQHPELDEEASPRRDDVKKKNSERRPEPTPDVGNRPLKGEGRKEGNQKSKQADSGELGQSSASDDGQKGSDNTGAGDKDTQAGNQDPAAKKTGQPGDKKKGEGSTTKPSKDGRGQKQSGPGENEGDKASPEGGERQEQGENGESGQESSEKASGQQGKGKSGNEGKSGQGQSDDGKSGEKDGGKPAQGATGKSSSKPSGKSDNAPGEPGAPGSSSGSRKTGNGVSSRPGEGNGPADGPPKDDQSEPPPPRQASSDDSPTPEEEEANLEYARKATNLVLQKLKSKLERGEVDQELLDEMGWKNKGDVERFVKFLESGLKAQQDESPEEMARRLQFEETLKNVRMGTQTERRAGSPGETRTIRQTATKNVRVPSEWLKAYGAYTRGLSKQSEPADAKAKDSKKPAAKK